MVSVHESQYMTTKYKRKPKLFFWQAIGIDATKTVSDNETNIDK